MAPALGVGWLGVSRSLVRSATVTTCGYLSASTPPSASRFSTRSASIRTGGGIGYAALAHGRRASTVASPPNVDAGVETRLLTVGVPKEAGDENRVSQSPDSIRNLIKSGFSVVVQAGAGNASSFSDADYEAAGAKIGSRDAAFGADIVLKVHAPQPGEVRCILLERAGVCAWESASSFAPDLDFRCHFSGPRLMRYRCTRLT